MRDTAKLFMILLAMLARVLGSELMDDQKCINIDSTIYPENFNTSLSEKVLIGQFGNDNICKASIYLVRFRDVTLSENKDCFWAKFDDNVTSFWVEDYESGLKVIHVTLAMSKPPQENFCIFGLPKCDDFKVIQRKSRTKTYRGNKQVVNNFYWRVYKGKDFCCVKVKY